MWPWSDTWQVVGPGCPFVQVPNGVGFGGQIGYWGMFVDGTSGLETGMSRESVTYARCTPPPPLSLWGRGASPLSCHAED